MYKTIIKNKKTVQQRFHHLDAELLLVNDVFYSVLPKHLFPPQPRGQGCGKAGRLTQLHGEDLCCLREGHYGDKIADLICWS